MYGVNDHGYLIKVRVNVILASGISLKLGQELVFRDICIPLQSSNSSISL